MVAVSNATPLIYLAKAHRLELLEKTYHQVYVCPEVWREAIQPIFTARPIPEDIPIILKALSLMSEEEPHVPAEESSV